MSLCPYCTPGHHAVGSRECNVSAVEYHSNGTLSRIEFKSYDQRYGQAAGKLRAELEAEQRRRLDAQIGMAGQIARY